MLNPDTSPGTQQVLSLLNKEATLKLDIMVHASDPTTWKDHAWVTQGDPVSKKRKTLKTIYLPF
jgi:hypothetical protein